MISLHLSFWWFLGKTPNLLIWTTGSSDLSKGPTTLLSAISFSRYSSTISGCCNAPSRFFLDALRLPVVWPLSPILKPSLIPFKKNCTNGWSGWLDRGCCHAIGLRGVCTERAESGTSGVFQPPAKWLSHSLSQMLYESFDGRGGSSAMSQCSRRLKALWVEGEGRYSQHITNRHVEGPKNN